MIDRTKVRPVQVFIVVWHVVTILSYNFFFPQPGDLPRAREDLRQTEDVS